ncbi:hypothetical protein VSH64_30970 [Amycolatopsis rhabdoformis]|uniref:Lipoprotein n=1 Tax=Amycolatopsis rhabdoformis TaxID=1448059 RepID=A0ABZ1HYR2_9PSEU|nr:hypothetical protein [Amycolatopsis rhabdoformis]WSE27271.1 hypothetical protein VSH64_30970 [Amycolatopsis rhabdoformis]
MRAGWIAAAVVLLGGALAGCQVAVVGSAGVSAADQQKADRLTEQREAVDAALDALGKAPALEFDTTVKDASGKPMGLGYRITRDGDGYGALPFEGHIVQITEPAGDLYLSADADYWKAHGLEENSTQFGTGWVHTVGTELPLDPAAKLAPGQLTAGLRKSLATLNQTADPVKHKLEDGTEVYQLGGGLGALQVTTAKPYRVVAFAPALIDPLGGPKLGTGFQVKELTGDALKKFHTDFDSALGGLGQPYDGLAQASVVVTNDRLDCKDFVGSCTATVDVTNSVVGNSPGTKPTVHVTLTIDVSADSLGSKTCSTAGDAAADATITMSCTVKFTLPNRTASYQVLAKPTAVGEVHLPFDANAVKAKLAKSFGQLGG